jgi:hypothetical protein
MWPMPDGSDGEMKHMVSGLLQLMESIKFVLIGHLMTKGGFSW